MVFLSVFSPPGFFGGGGGGEFTGGFGPVLCGDFFSDFSSRKILPCLFLTFFSRDFCTEVGARGFS